MPDSTQSRAPVVTPSEPNVERLAREISDLRSELEAVRAQVGGQHVKPESDDSVGWRGQLPKPGLGWRDQSSKRRFGRRRGTTRTVRTAEGEGISRRRLLGLAGTAAAAGVGGALLAGSPSEAVTGGNVIIDGSFSTNSGVGTTQLTSTGASSIQGFAFEVKNTGTGESGVRAEANGTGIAVQGETSTGSPRTAIRSWVPRQPRTTGVRTCS
jgi:hypothetical protein